ncbi:aspartyl aminopeptidase [Auriculariales sp. MPI-PUGE-AT-0066]|nr:aspartyl aminopeptidase [Auriculariales sp. MPI-PUGE-AT-0066]
MSSLCGERAMARVLAVQGSRRAGTVTGVTARSSLASSTMPSDSGAPQATKSAAQGLIDFLNASPTPFHAVANGVAMLEEAGFKRIYEDEDWESFVRPGGSYYYTRHTLAIIAFTLPHDWQPGRGLSIAGTHLDSPRLQVRPISKKSAEGYLQVGIEPYGGGLWSTWFDRDLGIAGRIIVKDSGLSGGFRTELVRIDRPLLRIPTLAPHLSTAPSNSFAFNLETQFVPILGQEHPGRGGKLMGDGEPPQQTTTQHGDKNELGQIQTALNALGRHHPELLEAVADQLQVNLEDMYELELSLYDIQPGTLGGAKGEFIFAPRMDNQFSTYCAIRAIVESTRTAQQIFHKEEGANVNVVLCFNHEEIGSVSTSGAASNIARSLIERLSPGPGPTARSIARSFIISSDVGHAIHPSYAAKYERNHSPRLNGGVSIKTNARQRYTSEGIGSFVVKQLAAKRGRTLQEYELPNDVNGGSTIGPEMSKLGIRTVDVGACLVSMHSIREQAGTEDVQALIDLFAALFDHYNEVADSLQIA